MEIKQTRHGDIIVLEPGGSLDTRSAQDLEREVVSHLNEGSELFVVDFRRVDQLASSGIRVLVMLAKRLVGSDGRLVICSLNEQVKTVLDIAGLAQYFAIAETRADAVADVYPQSKLGKLSSRTCVLLAENGIQVPALRASRSPRISTLAARVSDLLSGEGIEAPDVSGGRGAEAGAAGTGSAFATAHPSKGAIHRAWRKLKGAVVKPERDG